jgi:Questin oxidase-like
MGTLKVLAEPHGTGAEFVRTVSSSCRHYPTLPTSQQPQAAKSGEGRCFHCANTSISPPIMSAPMIAWVPLVNRIHRYLTTSTYAAQSIDIPSVEIHDVETSPEKRPRTLKHLIRANHVNHSIIYHKLQYHNHMPHLLGSAYLLGANVDQLQRIYDEEAKELEEWKDSPAEISDADWRDFLGDKRYQRAFVDFFEDELALKFGYDWKRVVEEYLFSGKEPLINGVVAGRKSVTLVENYLLTESISWPPSNPSWLRIRILK